MEKPQYDRRTVGAYLGLGVGFAASALVFAALGAFLDGRLGTTPLFTLLGVFVGGAAGFYSLYRRAIAVQKGEAGEDGREEQEREGTPEGREQSPHES